MDKTIGVIGLGYVGLPLALTAVESGWNVIGYDKNPDLIRGLLSGNSHIDDVSNERLITGISGGEFSLVDSPNSLSKVDICIICVPTPTTIDHHPDLTYVKSAANSISKILNPNCVIVNESTSYPGTLREVIKPLIDGGSNQSHLYAISPERVDPGNKSYGVKNTPRVVGGLSDQARDAAVAFYKSFCDEVIPVSSAEVAEAAKLFENTFRFINIGLVNEFAEIMSAMGIPADEVLKAAASKPYGFMPFHPNVGIGGHCIPVDPIYLQERGKKFGITSKYIALSEEINHSMPKYVARRLIEEYGDIKGKHLLVVGVSYKADISDTRESPAQPFIESLKELGAEVSWHDPLVPSWNGESSALVAGEYDLAVVLVAHSNLAMSGWKGGPIFTTNFNPKYPDWKPLISVQQKS